MTASGIDRPSRASGGVDQMRQAVTSLFQGREIADFVAAPSDLWWVGCLSCHVFHMCPQDSLSFKSNPLHPETTSIGQKMTNMTKAWALIATIKENPDITFRCPQDSQDHCESQCVRDMWEQRANVCWSDSLCLLLCLFSTLKTSQNRPFLQMGFTSYVCMS